MNEYLSALLVFSMSSIFQSGFGGRSKEILDILFHCITQNSRMTSLFGLFVELKPKTKIAMHLSYKMQSEDS